MVLARSELLSQRCSLIPLPPRELRSLCCSEPQSKPQPTPSLKPLLHPELEVALWGGGADFCVGVWDLLGPDANKRLLG